MRRVTRPSVEGPSSRARRRLRSDGERIVLEIFGPGPLAPRRNGPAEVAPVKAWLARARDAAGRLRPATTHADDRQTH